MDYRQKYIFLNKSISNYRKRGADHPLRRLFVTALAITLFLFVTGAALAANMDRFNTDLIGSEEVPPVTTDMNGASRFRFDAKNNLIDFRLRVRNGEAVTMAHLHCAPKGQNGPVVVTLFGMVPGGFDINGEMADYEIKNSNIVSGACADISDVQDLAREMSEGNIYVNVHTVEHPNGEIRGQLGD